MYAISNRYTRSLALWVAVPLAGFAVGHAFLQPRRHPRVLLRRVSVWRRFGPHRLLAPLDVARGPAGSMLVTDADAHRVYRVADDGRLLAAAGGIGQGPGEFIIPWGVCCDALGNVFVADTENNRIQVFDYNLQYRRSFTPGFAHPSGVAPDGHGGVWVSAGEYTVPAVPLVHYDGAGRVLGTLGPVRQTLPSTDDRGRLWVTDRRDVYDPVTAYDGGRETCRWGGESLRMAEKAAAANGLVFVADRNGPSIMVYDERGTVLGSASWQAVAVPGGLACGPYGIAVDDRGYVWICSPNGRGVERFQVVREP